MPSWDLADVEKRLEMNIQLGDLDLEKVRDSIYFFS